MQSSRISIIYPAAILSLWVILELPTVTVELAGGWGRNIQGIERCIQRESPGWASNATSLRSCWMSQEDTWYHSRKQISGHSTILILSESVPELLKRFWPQPWCDFPVENWLLRKWMGREEDARYCLMVPQDLKISSGFRSAFWIIALSRS